MEPRPLNRQPRAASPTPAPSPPPADRASWTPPAPAAPTHDQPSPTYSSSGPIDASATRAPWQEQPGVAGPPLPPHGYSPGPALTPIDSGRGSRLVGPILALVVLAAVVVSVVFVIFRFFDDSGDGTTANQPAPSTTAVAQAAPSGVATEEPTPAPTQSGGVVAGADEPAAPPSSEGSADTTPEPSPTPRPSGGQTSRSSPASARSMLPSASDLSGGYERTEDDKRSKDAVANSFSNPDEAVVNLDAWSWRENAYRTFELPADADPNSTTVINVSIHRFGREQGAKDALDYFADDVIATQGLEEFKVQRIGEQTRALKGATDSANLVVLYVRTDVYLIRIGGTSPQGDPTDDVIAVAEMIVE